MTFPIVEKFGGRAAAHTELKQAGHTDCTSDALRLWEHRQNMPSWAIIAFMDLASRKKIKYTPDDFKYTANTTH